MGHAERRAGLSLPNKKAQTNEQSIKRPTAADAASPMRAGVDCSRMYIMTK